MSSLNDVAAEFQPIFDKRAEEIKQEKLEAEHALELAKIRKEKKATDVADVFGDLLDDAANRGADIFTDTKETDR